MAFGNSFPLLWEQFDEDFKVKKKKKKAYFEWLTKDEGVQVPKGFQVSVPENGWFNAAWCRAKSSGRMLRCLLRVIRSNYTL